MPPIVSSPGPAPEAALAYFRAKGFKIGFDYRDVWREEHAVAFTVAKAMTQDLLDDIREEIDKAFEQGLPFHAFKKALVPVLVQRGWWGRKPMVDPKTGEAKVVQLGSPHRLRIIMDTNLRTARAVGQWQRIQRSKEARPYLLYRLGPSHRHRPEHEAWDGTLLPVDDPFWDTHFPPNGYGCKCRVRQVSAREAESLGGVTQRPSTERRLWENKRTGAVESVPVGIQPGFDRNVGQERLAPTY